MRSHSKANTLFFHLHGSDAGRPLESDSLGEGLCRCPFRWSLTAPFS